MNRGTEKTDRGEPVHPDQAARADRLRGAWESAKRGRRQARKTAQRALRERDNARAHAKALIETVQAADDERDRLETALADLRRQRNAALDLIGREHSDAAADIAAGGPDSQLEDLTVPVHDLLVTFGMVAPRQAPAEDRAVPADQEPAGE